MQDPDLLRRTSTVASSVLGYIASSSVAAIVVLQALVALKLTPGEFEPGFASLPALVAYAAVLASGISMVAAVPLVGIIWALEQFGISRWKMFTLAGWLIGATAFLAFAVAGGLASYLSHEPTIEVPEDDLLMDLMCVGVGVAVLAGGSAAITYRLVAGFEKHDLRDLRNGAWNRRN